MRNARWKLGAAIFGLIGLGMLVGVIAIYHFSDPDSRMFSTVEVDEVAVAARFSDGVPASFMTFAVLLAETEDAKDWKTGIVVNPEAFHVDDASPQEIPTYHIEMRGDETWLYMTTNSLRCNIDGSLLLDLRGIAGVSFICPSDPVLNRSLYWPYERRVMGLHVGYRYVGVIDGTISDHLHSLSSGYSLERYPGRLEWVLPVDVPYVQIVGSDVMPQEARAHVDIDIRSRDGIEDVEGAPKTKVIVSGPLVRDRPVIRIPLQPIGGGGTANPVHEGEPVYIRIQGGYRGRQGIPYSTVAYLKPGLVLEIDMRDVVAAASTR